MTNFNGCVPVLISLLILFSSFLPFILVRLAPFSNE